ncbi:MAG: 23S rRNA (adenine(2503)-C(2))-methyltransferase RlmN, partial [Oscillospiraceae bacterium]|nr:23S rRNA (adenine(2503)-C(2))-methyltransferase RlmN [Oscillospiraceae bacterium]
MGIGEPFDNFDAVMDFVKLANNPEGLNLGARHITISTCGLVPMIDKFAELDLQVNLSVSLHAPENELRKKLMPIARRYDLDELMAACRRYVARTNRRLTFEYSLFAGVNDTPAHAEMLVKLLGKGLWHVNLIAANEFPGSDYHTSPKQNVRRFQEILESGGINATLRREMGTDIMAACGQLRRGMENKDK